MKSPITKPATAIVLEDHPLVGRGITEYLHSVHPELAVTVVAQWREVMHLLRTQGCPRILVADIWLASGHCLEDLEGWFLMCSDSPWLAVSGDDDPLLIQRVRAAGARGFVHKQAPPESFGAAFKAVLDGDSWFATESLHQSAFPAPKEWTVSPEDLGLTPRQGEILRLIMRGLPNKRIASSLGITENTVKEHVTGILERLGVRNRVEAITQLRGRRIQLPNERLKGAKT
jgi:DNA-binding NarL/FixJ family response regulator